MKRHAQQRVTWQSARMGPQHQGTAPSAGEAGEVCSSPGTQVHLDNLPTELLSVLMLQLCPADALAACSSCKSLRNALADTHTMAMWLTKHRPGSEFRAASLLHNPVRAQQLFRCLHEQLHLDVHARDAHRQLPLHYACERGLADQAEYLIQVGLVLMMHISWSNVISPSGAHQLEMEPIFFIIWISVS